MENIQNLANAIIIQASKDYIEFGKKLKQLQNANKPYLSSEDRGRFEIKLKSAEADFNEVKRFFHSDWFGFLTSVDSQLILRKLDEEVASV